MSQPNADHICEYDTENPYYERDLSIVPAFDMPAQGTRDMTMKESKACMLVAIQAMESEGDHWLKMYCQPGPATDILTIIIASKLNWFTTNHHVGQGYATKYICKVINNTYKWCANAEAGISEAAKNAAWKVGHWASTHLCLRILEMRTGVWVIVHPAASPLGAVFLSADYKVRCESAPAGLAKVALVHANLTLFRNNTMWMLAPKFQNILDCFLAYKEYLQEVVTCREKRMVDPRCKDHEGGRYLTNRVDKTGVLSMVAPLGVVGSFLFWKQPSNTLAASPPGVITEG